MCNSTATSTSRLSATFLLVMRQILPQYCVALRAYSSIELLLQALAVENIVLQDQGHVILADKILPDQKRLSQSCRLRLYGIGDRTIDLLPVTEHTRKVVDVCGCGNQKNITDVGQNQRGVRMYQRHWYLRTGADYRSNDPLRLRSKIDDGVRLIGV